MPALAPSRAHRTSIGSEPVVIRSRSVSLYSTCTVGGTLQGSMASTRPGLAWPGQGRAARPRTPPVSTFLSALSSRYHFSSHIAPHPASASRDTAPWRGQLWGVSLVPRLSRLPQVQVRRCSPPGGGGQAREDGRARAGVGCSAVICEGFRLARARGYIPPPKRWSAWFASCQLCHGSPSGMRSREHFSHVFIFIFPIRHRLAPGGRIPPASGIRLVP